MSESVQPGALYVVSTPIGNLGDISRRAAEILAGVNLIAAEDTRTTRVLLDHLGVTTPLVSYYSQNEVRRVPELLEKLLARQSIALVSDAGTPGISDPAYALVHAAVDAGVQVIAIPGPSALLAALVASGLPMDRFVFEGFLPLKKGRRKIFDRLRDEMRTVVLYESPHRIARTLAELAEALGNRPAVVARELTKKFEEIRRGLLPRLADEVARGTPRGEYVVVIGGATKRGATDITVESAEPIEEPTHGDEEENGWNRNTGHAPSDDPSSGSL